MRLNECLPSDFILLKLVLENDLYRFMVKYIGLMFPLSMLHLPCHLNQVVVEIIGHVKNFYPCELHEKSNTILVQHSVSTLACKLPHDDPH